MADIKTHPDYEARQTEFTQQKAAAQAVKDEVMEAKAENAWLQHQMRMTSELSTQETAKANKESALAKMKAEYPTVPEASYRHLGDYSSMEEVAKEVVAAIGTPPPVDTPPPSGPTGQVPSTRTSTSLHEDQKYLADLRERARANKPGAAEEVKKHVFKEIMLPSMARFGPAREEGIKKGVRR